MCLSFSQAIMAVIANAIILGVVSAFLPKLRSTFLWLSVAIGYLIGLVTDCSAKPLSTPRSSELLRPLEPRAILVGSSSPSPGQTLLQSCTDSYQKELQAFQDWKVIGFLRTETHQTLIFRMEGNSGVRYVQVVWTPWREEAEAAKARGWQEDEKARCQEQGQTYFELYRTFTAVGKI